MRSIRQRISIIIAKCDFTPGRYIWNYYLCQTATVSERTIVDCFHAVGDGYRCQAGALRERIAANARHAVGNGDRGQTATAKERIVADSRHAVGNNQILNLSILITVYMLSIIQRICIIIAK